MGKTAVAGIQPFNQPTAHMKMWPALAAHGKLLSLPEGELFFYDLAGAGSGAQKPALVFVHGLGDEADTWRHILPEFARKGYRVIAPDLPGFGRTQWRGRINVRSHAKAVVRLIAESGAASPQNPAVLVGSSLGAGVAELAAFRQPALVRALVLIDGCFPFSGSFNKGFYLLALPFAGKRWYRSFRSNHEGAWESLRPYYTNLGGMGAEEAGFLRERVIARVESPNQERGYFATLRSLNWYLLFGRFVFARKVRRFPQKTLLLWGENDRIFPASKNAVFRAIRPDAAFKTIAGAGHLPQQEKPQETAEEISRFLADLEETNGKLQ